MMDPRMENLNYAADPRNCELAKTPVLYFVDEDGCDSEIKLPTKWEVCGVCSGRGTHVDPAIDCCGLSAEDFNDDPEFLDDYFNGQYDQRCNRCGGRTTIEVVDLDDMNEVHREAYEQQLRDEANDRACYLAEVRAGC